jgi:hypothetical protein
MVPLLAFWCVFLVWWFLGGRAVVKRMVDKMAEPWADFHVPSNAVPLEGLQVSLSGRTLTLCNKSKEGWSKILVQIDEGYLAAQDKLRPGECKEIPIENFATASWKRMPPSSELKVTNVEVLATVVRTGYASSQPKVLDRPVK